MKRISLNSHQNHFSDYYHNAKYQFSAKHHLSYKRNVICCAELTAQYAHDLCAVLPLFYFQFCKKNKGLNTFLIHYDQIFRRSICSFRIRACAESSSQEAADCSAVAELVAMT